MKSRILLVILLFGFFASQAQRRPSSEKIESARIGWITERLELSPEVAQKFWPIYNAYSEKRMELRNEFRELRHNTDLATASNEKSRELIDKQFSLKEKEITLEKSLADDLLEVISPRQYLVLRKAEDDFRRMLFDKIREHHEGRGKDGPPQL